MRTTAGRSTRRFKRLQANLKAQKRPCHLCGQPIDYTLPHTAPMAFQLDHYYPLSTHPHLAEDPGNLRASHAKCNKNRGATPMTNIAGLGITAKDW